MIKMTLTPVQMIRERFGDDTESAEKAVDRYLSEIKQAETAMWCVCLENRYSDSFNKIFHDIMRESVISHAVDAGWVITGVGPDVSCEDIYHSRRLAVADMYIYMKSHNKK